MNIDHPTRHWIGWSSVAPILLLALCGCGGGSKTPPPALPDFSISVGPGSQTATPGNSTTYTVTVTGLSGFTGTVSFSLTGLPSGATGSFNPASISASGNSTLTVATATTSPMGTSSLTITGTSGGLMHSTTVSFVVNPSPPMAPTNLAATAGNAQVSLSWAASSGVSSYNVLRSTTNGGPYTQIAAGEMATSYTDTSVTNGTTYYYVVRSNNSGGTSPNSNQASATPSGELQTRVTANQMGFYVYKDQDSGFNHGFPSGVFSNGPNVTLNSGCIDNQADTATGCFPPADTTVLDMTRGTVFSIAFGPMSTTQFAGLNFEEPQSFGANGQPPGTIGYDLTGAANVVFDVRSPSGMTVQFGVGQCVENNFRQISQNWTTITIPLSSLIPPPNLAVPCPPALGTVHFLFTVATNGSNAPNGGTILLDSIHFTPVPARQTTSPDAFSLPVSTLTFGVVPQTNAPFPPDQLDRSVAAVYESALTIRALVSQGDATNAKKVADALDYALFHDNEGDYISMSPGSTHGCFSGAAATQCGLHNAYETGDIALLNDQNGGSGSARAGDSRLAGFTCSPAISGNTGFCLVLDGSTGGNNAWVILALLAEYKQSGIAKYLNDAIAIGNWIIANLQDTTGTGYGGYFVGYPDQGAPPPKPLNAGKSTENNADIFAAFTELAEFDPTNASAWTTAANAAGDFVMQMFDQPNGRFNVGTLPANNLPPYNPQNGNCPSSQSKGSDVINTCDFLDADTFTTLAMAGTTRYSKFIFPDGSTMDWTRPVQYVLNTFPQTISVSGQTFQGFNLIVSPAEGGGGIAWEFTGQAVVTMRYVDQLYNRANFESKAAFYLGQLEMAQLLAPFGDKQGLVASTLQNGDMLAPVDQCLSTPFQNCPAERVGLAATDWKIFAEQNINPLTRP